MTAFKDDKPRIERTTRIVVTIGDNEYVAQSFKFNKDSNIDTRMMADEYEFVDFGDIVIPMPVGPRKLKLVQNEATYHGTVRFAGNAPDDNALNDADSITIRVEEETRTRTYEFSDLSISKRGSGVIELVSRDKNEALTS